MSAIIVHTKRSCSVCRDLRPESPSVATNDQREHTFPPEADGRSLSAPCAPAGLVSLSDIRKSADLGCHGCRVLNSIMPPYWDAFRLDESCSWNYSVLEGHFTIQMFRRNTYAYRSRMDLAGTLQLWTITPQTCPWNLTTPPFDVDAKTSEYKTIGKIREWLSQCREAHDNCRSIAQTPKLPTRVVEILGREKVRLREHVDETAPYVCLSHCWGTAEFIQTNVDTVSRHKDSIVWSELPKTFQDAISVTHQLGFRYIWIDSLCIIQGDTEDWLREGSKMCDIYSKAHLTIAATRSTSPSHGCYGPRGLFNETTHKFLSVEGAPYTIHVRGRTPKRIYSLPHINDYEHYELFPETPNPFPLLQRAWAFQERILSLRVVHFGPHELLWECLDLKTCECSKWPGYDGTAKGLNFEEPYMLRDNVPSTFAGTPITDPVDWKWRRIVEQFTSRSLTYQSDIFPALQGVAKSMQAGRQYHAGLWDDKNLLANLLWRVRDPREKRDYYSMWAHLGSAHPYNPPNKINQSPRPGAWRAPTWSWASVTKPVIFDVAHAETYERLATIVSIQTQLAGLDPLGQLKAGSMTLKGRCAEARICVGYVNDQCQMHRRDDPVKLLIGVKYDSIVKDQIEIRNIEDMVAGTQKGFHEPIVTDEGFIETFFADYDIPLDDRAVCLMEILRWHKRGSDWSTGELTETLTEMYSYLAFGRVDVAMDTYERIGCFHTTRRIKDELFINEGEEMTLKIV